MSKREFKGTPGPWVRFVKGNLLNIHQQGVFNKIVGMVYLRFCQSTAEAEANANLIAAAPELLESLEFQCLRCLADIAKHNALSEDKQDADCGDCVCGRAIAKAYGDQP